MTLERGTHNGLADSRSFANRWRDWVGTLGNLSTCHIQASVSPNWEVRKAPWKHGVISLPWLYLFIQIDLVWCLRLSVVSCKVFLVGNKGLPVRVEMSEVKNATEGKFCPDCESEITDSNPMIDDCYNPEDYGYCVNCYDPTPAGVEYSAGFEREH